MKKLLLPFSFLLVIVISNNIFSQPVFEENFDYPVGDSLINHGWVNHSGTGNQIAVTSGSLTYAGYTGSGIGNSAALIGGSGSREDIHANFTNAGSGNLYVAFLVSVSAATAAGDYFFHFAPAFPTSTFRGRVWVKDDGAGNLQFGVSKGSSSEVTYTTTAYLYNVAYLLILKYESIGELGDDDVVRLFINPDFTKLESYATYVTSADTSSDIFVGSLVLRQGTLAYAVNIDGIKIVTGWDTVLPVELTSFDATVSNNEVELKWTTTSELNNFGFEIQRSKDLDSRFENLQDINQVSNPQWRTIGFIRGQGTTTRQREYFYIDKPYDSGKYFYRLKQVDFDGSYRYSLATEVDYVVITGFELSQNYPNPFNPTTTIKFSLPQATNLSLKVFNILGQEIKTLVSRFMEKGSYSINFDAKDLNGGIYFYQLEVGDFSIVRKMILIK